MNTPRKKAIISLPRELVRKIADEFSCTEVTVYRALCFGTDSAKAKQIRDSAMSYGGLLTEKLV